jgi:hypothetical protein
MRFVGAAVLSLAALSFPRTAFAQGVAAPGYPQAYGPPVYSASPAPYPTAPGYAPYPPPAYPLAPPQGPPPDLNTTSARRTSVLTFGAGPTLFAELGSTTSENLRRPGLALETTGRLPLGTSAGIGLRFAWGFTEFERAEEFTDFGYSVGSWTTTAYKEVWAWSGKKE